MQLTRTNAVFSRISLVSSFRAEKSTFEKNSEFNCNHHISPEDPRNQKGRRRGCTRQPRHTRARQGVGPRPQVWRGHLGNPPTLPFGLLKPLDLNINGGFVIFRETYPRSAANAIPILDPDAKVMALIRDWAAMCVFWTFYSTSSNLPAMGSSRSGAYGCY